MWVRSSLGWQEKPKLTCSSALTAFHFLMCLLHITICHLLNCKFTRRLELKLGYCIENQWVQSTILISTDDGIKAK